MDNLEQALKAITIAVFAILWGIYGSESVRSVSLPKLSLRV